MKRFMTAAAALSMVFAFAAAASAQGILGSAHDFNNETAGDDAWNSSNEVCSVCHTPHNSLNAPNAAGVDPKAGPLWNHSLPTSASYTPYTGYDMQATDMAITGTSALCLSCHDGTVALESFGGNVAGTTTVMGDINANADLDQDLRDDHPVGMTYETSDTELRGLTYQASWMTSGQTIQSVLLNGGTKVECSSCHDVHNADNNTYLLRTPNSNSQLCFTCHDK